MLKLSKKIKNSIDTWDAVDAMNELMGKDNFGKSMGECLALLLDHAGIANRVVEVYKAGIKRIGKRVCYSFGFVCDGCRYGAVMDRITGEILRYRFRLA